MSKILVIGDLHGNHLWAKKMIGVAFAEDIKTIFQVGDFGVWPGKEGKEYLLILSRYLVKKKRKLYFLPGNHEDYNQIDRWEQNFPKNQDGHIEIEPNLFYIGKVNKWTWNNKIFAAVGGAVSIDKKWRKLNVSWWPQEQLTDEEVNKAISMGQADFLFTHDCPTMHPFRHLKNDLESEIHRQKMTTCARAIIPKLWFHGHYHQYEQYTFDHQKGTARVFGLDADDKASRLASLKLHAAVLDTETEEVTSIDKHFNWHTKNFWFDKKHETKNCAICNPCE